MGLLEPLISTEGLLCGFQKERAKPGVVDPTMRGVADALLTMNLKRGRIGLADPVFAAPHEVVRCERLKEVIKDLPHLPERCSARVVWMGVQRTMSVAIDTT